MKKPYYVFVSAGNIVHFSQDFLCLRYYRFLFIRSEIKLYYNNIDSCEGYLKRVKPLSDLEFSYVKDEISLTHKKQAMIAATVKWGLLAIIILLSIIIVVLATTL